MLPSLVFGLVLCSVSVKSLTVTWNGTTITGPVLIFQDELVRDERTNVLATPMDGTVICRSENQAQVGWHFTNNVLLSTSSATNHFRQRRTSSSATPSVSRLTTNRPDGANTSAAANGLWTCRLNAGFGTAVPVGIYARGGGRGAISGIQVSLTSFQSDPPTFTLLSATSGGPPTTYTWTRNGQVIINSASYSISIQVERSPAGFQNSRYRSTLTVTGRLPGVYQYSVTNRATSGMRTDTFTIESGAPPTDVTAEQTGVSTVLVMWTAPSPPPSNGYQVQITRGSTTTTVNVAGTSHTFSVNNQYGVYSIQVRSLSRHFQSNEAAPEPVEITVRGNLPPVISTSSPTATSVTITWTQPEFSLPVVGYTVTVTRVTGSGQVLCPSFVEEDQSTTTSPSVTTTTFTGLQEFSSYTLRVTANFSPAFGLSAPMDEESMTFTTLSSAPTGPPRDVTPSITSRSVSVSWSTIDCIERNGVITNYTVAFQEQGGAVIPGDVNTMDRTFTASGLTPHTNYIFRVAGVNNNGTGPYSNDITVLTNEDVPSVVSDLAGQPKFTSIVLTWSAPQEPNGVIISYEVTYRVGDGNLITTNTTDLRFTIPSLTPGTNVTEISVSAYTSVGRGDPVQIPHLVTLSSLPIVMNITVLLLSATSLRVSWDRLDIPEITGYIVYYSQTGNSEMVTIETSVTVVGSEETFVVIDNLRSGVEYQFQVVAVAELDGDVVMGERSAMSIQQIIIPTPATENSELTTAVSIAVVATFILTLILYTPLLLLVLYCVYRCHGTSNTKMTKVMEMKENEAYGPVSSSQPQPPLASEGAYDL